MNKLCLSITKIGAGYHWGLPYGGDLDAWGANIRLLDGRRRRVQVGLSERTYSRGNERITFVVILCCAFVSLRSYPTEVIILKGIENIVVLYIPRDFVDFSRLRMGRIGYYIEVIYEQSK